MNKIPKLGVVADPKDEIVMLRKKIETLEKQLLQLAENFSKFQQSQNQINLHQEGINNSAMRIVQAMQKFQSNTEITLTNVIETLELHQSVIIALEQINYNPVNEDRLDALDLSLPKLEDPDKKLN